MKRLVEIRSYKLKPGTAAQFHDAAAGTVVLMLRKWGMDVVAFGPSAHDAFYGSAQWRGPRESIVSRIESYLRTVLWLSPDSIEDLRRSNA